MGNLDPSIPCRKTQVNVTIGPRLSSYPQIAPQATNFRFPRADCVCTAAQAAEKLNFDLFCYKGTTLAGPQMQQNKGWALAPAAFLHHNRRYFGIFSASSVTASTALVAF
jgi:hypothetical protein